MAFIHENENYRALSRSALVCKTLSVICRIIFAILALWGIAATSLMCLSLVTSTLSAESIPFAFAVPIIYFLYMANSCLMPFILWKMLEDISEERTPFTLENASRLFRLAIVLLLYAILEALLIAADTQFLLTIGDDSIQVGNFIYDFASHSGTSLNMFPLIMASVFFALSYVFKYGVLLQQESDETL